MEEKIEEFKQFHKIETEIDLLFKIENDRLFAFYNDRWVQLSREKNPKKIYSPATLQTYYNAGLLKKLGFLSINEKYSKERYAKYRESYRKASKRKRKQKNLRN